jgi:hypothetical protein
MRNRADHFRRTKQRRRAWLTHARLSPVGTPARSTAFHRTSQLSVLPNARFLRNASDASQLPRFFGIQIRYCAPSFMHAPISPLDNSRKHRPGAIFPHVPDNRILLFVLTICLPIFFLHHGHSNLLSNEKPQLEVSQPIRCSFKFERFGCSPSQNVSPMKSFSSRKAGHPNFTPLPHRPDNFDP